MDQQKAKVLQKKLRPLLIPPSLLYGFAVNVREGYLLRKKKREFKNIKIISVGNIVAGGVGKTPISIKIAEFLMDYGRVGVITGMYPIRDKRVHVVSIEGKIFKKPPKVPDEAYMIAKKLPVTVISSKNRIAALELAEGLRIDFAILDDALHIVNVKKDLEICVFDKVYPLSNGFYLPAGLIRNSKGLLKNCSFNICVEKGDCEGNKKRINCLDAKVIPLGIFDFFGKKVELKGRKAFAFCGIGNPESFVSMLEKFGLDVVGVKFFNDHHMYTKDDVLLLKEEKKNTGAEVLITTFKDFVKIESKDLFYLDIDVKIKGVENIIEKVL